jgi:uncharacterized pyridoxal phosphate-containing UPF0001 family protein
VSQCLGGKSFSSRSADGEEGSMTEDFEAAIEEGATIVRVGRAVFGERL